MAKKDDNLDLPAPPTLDFSGIDALLASFFPAIAKQTAAAQKQVRQNAADMRREAAQNRRLNRSLLAEIRANRRPPDFVPLPPSLSTAEVQSAARQTRRDAASRMGLRRSILAGETGAAVPRNAAGSLLA